MSLENEWAQLHKPLLRLAQLQLRNDSMAEDVVSKTFLAVLEKPDNFEGRPRLGALSCAFVCLRVLLMPLCVQSHGKWRSREAACGDLQPSD